MDATVDALRQVIEEVDRMRSTDVSTEEMQREQQGAIAALPATFGTASRSIGVFRNLTFYGLPLDWHIDHERALAATTVDDIRKAAKLHLPDGPAVVLVVGDGEAVRAELVDLASERGVDLVELDVDGHPVTR